MNRGILAEWKNSKLNPRVLFAEGRRSNIYEKENNAGPAFHVLPRIARSKIQLFASSDACTTAASSDFQR